MGVKDSAAALEDSRAVKRLNVEVPDDPEVPILKPVPRRSEIYVLCPYDKNYTKLPQWLLLQELLQSCHLVTRQNP